MTDPRTMTTSELVSHAAELREELGQAEDVQSVYYVAEKALAVCDAAIARAERAERVVSAARWVTVSALDADSDPATLAMVRPTAAQELVEALQAYDAIAATATTEKEPGT